MSSNDERAKRMTNKLVKEPITSYVLDIISVKSINHNELEILTLTDSKISEIARLFKMKENDYHSLIYVLFVTDKSVNEITEALAYNHQICTQDGLPTKRIRKLDVKTQSFTSATSSTNKKSK